MELGRVRASRNYIYNPVQLTEDIQVSTESNILWPEVVTAIQSLLDRNSPGTVEVLLSMEDRAVDAMHSLCNMIWENTWLSDWQKFAFVPIFKQRSPLNCGNYRIISLISHTFKVLLHIFHKCQILEEQAAFIPRKDEGTGPYHYTAHISAFWLLGI